MFMEQNSVFFFMSTVCIRYVVFVVGKSQRQWKIKMCNFSPPSGFCWRLHVMCCLIVRSTEVIGWFPPPLQVKVIKSRFIVWIKKFHQWIQLESAYEMKLPSMCIVGVMVVKLTTAICSFVSVCIPVKQQRFAGCMVRTCKTTGIFWCW